MRAAVIGGGISGLAAAREITRAGGEAVVFESSDRVGGRIRTERRDGRTFDIGAFIYLGSYRESVELMGELGLEAQMSKVPANGALPRGGQLHRLEMDRPLRTALTTDYLSTAEKLRMTKLLVALGRRWKALNYTDASGVAQIDVDTVESWCRRELGQDLLDYVGSVVVRGPWLSDASYASFGQLLWTLKNFFVPWFYGLDDGMDALPRAMADRLDVRLNTPVLNVTDAGDQVDVETATGTESFERAVIATPTGAALQMFPQMRGIARGLYESTEYICSVNTHLALNHVPANDATYIMCSPQEQRDLCGVIVDHLKARHRVPAGEGMLTVFCRHEWGLERLETPDEQIVEEVLGFLAPYYGDLTGSVVDHEIGRWRDVVPIMTQGRFKAVDAYLRSIDPSQRVQLAGDHEAIPGVNGALVSGTAAGRRVAGAER